MRRNTQRINQILRFLIVTIVPITVILYCLRGIGWFGFINGGFLLLLISVSVFTLLFFLISLTY
jgi:hypothetical protein